MNTNRTLLLVVIVAVWTAVVVVVTAYVVIHAGSPRRANQLKVSPLAIRSGADVQRVAQNGVLIGKSLEFVQGMFFDRQILTSTTGDSIRIQFPEYADGFAPEFPTLVLDIRNEAVIASRYRYD